MLKQFLYLNIIKILFGSCTNQKNNDYTTRLFSEIFDDRHTVIKKLIIVKY
jgi:hypothetical protein